MRGKNKMGAVISKFKKLAGLALVFTEKRSAVERLKSEKEKEDVEAKRLTEILKAKKELAASRAAVAKLRKEINEVEH